MELQRLCQEDLAIWCSPTGILPFGRPPVLSQAYMVLKCYGRSINASIKKETHEDRAWLYIFFLEEVVGVGEGFKPVKRDGWLKEKGGEIAKLNGQGFANTHCLFAAAWNIFILGYFYVLHI